MEKVLLKSLRNLQVPVQALLWKPLFIFNITSRMQTDALWALNSYKCFQIVVCKDKHILPYTEEKEDVFNHHKELAFISQFKEGNVGHLQMFSNWSKWLAPAVLLPLPHSLLSWLQNKHIHSISSFFITSFHPTYINVFCYTQHVCNNISTSSY